MSPVSQSTSISMRMCNALGEAFSSCLLPIYPAPLLHPPKEHIPTKTSATSASRTISNILDASSAFDAAADTVAAGMRREVCPHYHFLVGKHPLCLIA
ncbi:hypothetical protein TNCV_2146021 [Trichonephila clavipes]|uniref:Uncharacterized protein n=1 Tax=Trichonephila clavipes TaxID=2585209 RepID=A0A8X6VN87_TRICX|nr:hypothetical protein TNCV_2146021 [Trichonephila clavipes]